MAQILMAEPVKPFETFPQRQSRDSAAGLARCEVVLCAAFCTEICIVRRMAILVGERLMSVTAASERGVSGLLKVAESGTDIVVERHGHPVAAIVSMRHLHELAELEADLRSAALVLARAATDNGQRTDLDEIISTLGFKRSDLEAEIDAELAAER